MKKIYSFLFSALIILVFNSCQDFEVPEYQGEVKFSLDIWAGVDQGSDVNNINM
jgi:hypothetical protein